MADHGILLGAQSLALRAAQYQARPAKAHALTKTPPLDTETKRLKDACDSFEALFMQQMLKQMRATVPKDGLFSGGSAEQMYSEMLDAELSKEMAGNGGLGISRLLFEHMTAAQKIPAKTKD